MNLRDALLGALATVAGTRVFHAHVLVSAPRKHASLFPFATPRPKPYLQHILVLVSEQPRPDAPRVLVAAIEAFLYHLPASDSAVLYVSKVDSTGQATHPSPTPALVRALLAYHLDPATRPLPVAHVWVHLFARAQAQYLFPNSAEFPGKRPLSDVKLCAWWKRQLGAVAHALEGRLRVRLFYLLPGLAEQEAAHALDRVYPSTPTPVPWTYGHPYAQADVPLPCGTPIGRDQKPPHIGHVVPWFDDDPKARFLDEIAYTTDGEGVRSPERKRPRTTHAPHPSDEDAEPAPAPADTPSEHTARALRRVSVDEFWERMSFRQECIAGALTGFFVMATSSPRPAARSDAPSGAPLPGQVSAQMMKRVLTSLMTGHEFPSVERAVWSTRVLEETIRGLCDGLKIVRGEDARRTPERASDSAGSTLGPPQTPPARHATLVDVSPNSFPEPVASVETYDSYIYGSVAVRNADEPRKGSVEGDGKPVITVLTARRKKRGKA